MRELRTPHDFRQACVGIVARRHKQLRNNCRTIIDWIDGVNGCAENTTQIIVSPPMSEIFAIIEHAAVIREITELQKTVGVSYEESKAKK